MMGLSTVKSEIRVVRVQTHDRLLEGIAALWRKSKKTLGFFPEQALTKYADRGEILGAIDPEENLLGYLLYYRSRKPPTGSVRIIHLCVEEEYRNRGIARQLLASLREETATCSGVSVQCRQDFPAHSLWSKLGFYPLREVDGRAGLPLTVWWLDYGHPDLVSQAREAELLDKVVVVIDACVFFAIHDEDTSENVESQALLAEWIPNSFAFCVAPELRNEIGRCQDENLRMREMAALRCFGELRASPDELNEARTSLRRLFPEEMRQSDESDLRQLAYCVCCGADTFLTFDPRLLALDEAIYEQYGISIQRPSAFISAINEAVCEHEYRPARLLGSQMDIRRVKGNELDRLVETFQLSEAGERRSSLKERLARILSQPAETSLTVMTAAGQPIFLCSMNASTESYALVEVIRVAGSSVSLTLADFLATFLVREAIAIQARVIRITDPFISRAIEESLQNLGFRRIEGQWYRAVLSGIATCEDTTHSLRQIASECVALQSYLDEYASSLLGSCSRQEWSEVSEIERAIWPARIEQTSIPAYVVPIRPAWAAELFDSSLARARLLPSDPSLILRSENVYYTGVVGSTIESPARLLWYVSHERGILGSKGIRAASTLEEVAIGPAKDVFRRFRRLGVYEWRDVAAIARRNGDVTALRFGRTVVFPYSISWDGLRDTLRVIENRSSMFQRATRIKTLTFDSLYRQGIGDIRKGELWQDEVF